MASKTNKEEPAPDQPEQEAPAADQADEMPPLPEAGKPFDPHRYVKWITRYDKQKKLDVQSPFLPAGARVTWFRHEHPIEAKWRLVSNPIEVTFDDTAHAFFFAAVIDPDGITVGTGHAVEWRSAFGDYVQKAETDAKSRALGDAGFGAVFDVDIESGPPPPEQQRPQQYADRRGQNKPPQQQTRPAAVQQPTGNSPPAAGESRYAVAGMRPPNIDEIAKLDAIFKVLDGYDDESRGAWDRFALGKFKVRSVTALRAHQLNEFYDYFMGELRKAQSEEEEGREIGDDEDLGDLGDLEELPDATHLLDVPPAAPEDKRWGGK